MIRRFLLALVMLLGGLPLAVQAQQPEAEPELPRVDLGEAPLLRFEQLSLEDGLSQSSVYNILQDRQGFMWFATQDGLNRFDGHTFEVFRPVPFDTTSLSDLWVWDVYEDRAGALWVGTQAGGLNKMVRATNTFTHYRHDPADTTSLSHESVTSILEGRDGTLWAATWGGGLNRMDPAQDGHFLHLRHDPEDTNSLSHDDVYFLHEDAEGMIWASARNGLNRVDPATGTVTRYLYDEDRRDAAPVFDMYEAPDAPGVLWVGTGDGLVRLDYGAGGFERFRLDPAPGTEGDPVNQIASIAADPVAPGVLWVASQGGGIARFDTRAKRFTRYQHDPEDPHSLAGNDAFAIRTDRSGTMWVGHQNNGLSVFNSASVDFTHLRHDPRDPSSLSPGIVWSVLEDRTGTLWVGTMDEQNRDYLTRFDAASGTVAWLQHDPGDPTTLTSSRIRVLYEDQAGTLWVGTATGLNRYDRTTGTFTRYRVDSLAGAAGPHNALFSVHEAPSEPGVLWVGTLGGLKRFDMRTETFTPYVIDPDDADGTPAAYVFEDRQGVLWVGSFFAGLYRVDRAAGTAVNYRYDPRDPNTPSNNWVGVLHERAREPGVLWLGTLGGGLNRFDTRTETFTHYTTADGLANDVVYGILEDSQGRLWLSTNRGLSVFDPEAETFRNYGLESGLQALEFNQNAYARGPSGVLYFGNVEGLTAFVPEQLSGNPNPPPVALTDFRLHNASVAVGPGSPLKRALAETEEIRLTHDQNEFAFDFVALHYANPEKNRYAYKLDGFDAGWVQAGTQRTATYTNLDPGRYTFRVKAANPDGVWNEEGVAVRLIITPPWWRTWWAYGLYAVLFAATVFAVDRVQRRRVLRKEQERAHIREAELRAEAAEAQSKALQAENERKKNVELLSEIGKEITASLDRETIFMRVYEHVNHLVDAPIFGIGLYHPERQEIEYRLAIERGKRYTPYTRNTNDKNQFPVWCIDHRQPVFINDVEREYSRYIDAYAHQGGRLEDGSVAERPHSLIYLPLLTQDRVLGVISIQSFRKHAYTEHDLNLLRTLATYTAIALDNARAYRRLNETLEHLRMTQQQLIQSEKMASLGQLTAGIAHEIKNPLNFVTNFAGLTRELAEELEEELDAGTDREALQALLSDLQLNARKIEEHGQRADGIVRSMMQHAQGGEGSREAVDLNALVSEYVDLAYHGKRAQAPGFNAAIEKQLSDAVGQVEMVPQEIGRVVLNLVGNAFDAVYEQATKVNGQYLPTVTVSTRRAGDRVEIRVADNGPGISETVRAKVFEPFYTTKPAGSGTGLGLSLSYEIVTQGHGGALAVESGAGQGATLVVTLPANPSHA